MQTHSTRRLHLARPLALAIAAMTSGGAWADEPSPYYLGVTQAFTHDSNVTGTVGGGADTYSSTGLTGGLDQLISRQHLYANANVHYNKYRSNTQLDNTSYGLAAGWDWATIEQLSGSFGVSANQSLASQNTTAGLVNTSTEKNLAKTDQFNASVAWGGAGALGLQGAYAHSRVSYSAASFFTGESSSDSASAGVSYRLGPDIRLGTGYRASRTVSPHSIYTPPVGADPADPVVSGDPANYTANSVRGRNIDLTADWTVTPQTGVNARLSWTRQTNATSASALDFSGLTGALSARYAATAKLSFGASISRDAGTNASFFNVPPAAPVVPVTPVTTPVASSPGLTQNTQTTDSYSLTAGYAVTAKINMNASAGYTRAKVINTTVVGAATTATESTDASHAYSIGVDYAATRSWQLGCHAGHTSRSLSVPGGGSYGGNTVGCSAQFTLR